MNTPPSALGSQTSTPDQGSVAPDPGPDSPPVFPRAPGETPRAFSAFAAYFLLGRNRSQQAVAAQLGENFGTVRKWASKYGWPARIQAHAAGLLEQHARAQVAAVRDHTADWARRNQELREQQWLAAQKLIRAADCFLDSFGDQELQRMNLSQVSRALQIGSRLAHTSLSSSPLPEEPGSLAPIQVELMAALKKMFGPDTDLPDLPASSDAQASTTQPPAP